MVNQAALKAANDGQTLVNMNHLNFAKDKILMGLYLLTLCRSVADPGISKLGGTVLAW